MEDTKLAWHRLWTFRLFCPTATD